MIGRRRRERLWERWTEALRGKALVQVFDGNVQEVDVLRLAAGRFAKLRHRDYRETWYDVFSDVRLLTVLLGERPAMTPPAVRAKKLTAQQTVKTLVEFFDSHGPVVIHESYGWRVPPDMVERGERMYAFYSAIGPGKHVDLVPYAPVRVGWGSVHLNPRDGRDDEAVLLVGVFPAAERQGYRTAILAWLAAYAQKQGAARASMIVLKTNDKHYRRTIREAATGQSGWTYAGDVWYPAPGYGYFVYPFTEAKP